MQRLRKTNKGLRYFLPTALLVVGLFVAGIMLAKDSDTPNVAAEQLPKTVTPLNNANVPKLGEKFKFGSYIIHDNTPDPIEQLLGQKLEVVGWYTHWNRPIASQKLKNTCASNYVPAITWESWQSGTKDVSTPWSLQDIAAGKFDDKISHELKQVVDVCKNKVVIIRFDHEMNTNRGDMLWYPWQGNPEAYVAAWQHIVTISHGISPNIKWLWSPNHTADVDLVEPYYPGEKYVDYVGISLNKGDNSIEQPQSFAAFYEQSQAKIESFNKPVIIAETAVVEGNDPQRKSDWIRGMFDYAKHKKRITAVLYFNEVTKREGIAKDSYLINSSPTTLTTFQESLREYRSEQ